MPKARAHREPCNVGYLGLHRPLAPSVPVGLNLFEEVRSHLVGKKYLHYYPTVSILRKSKIPSSHYIFYLSSPFSRSQFQIISSLPSLAQPRTSQPCIPLRRPAPSATRLQQTCPSSVAPNAKIIGTATETARRRTGNSTRPPVALRSSAVRRSSHKPPPISIPCPMPLAVS